MGNYTSCLSQLASIIIKGTLTTDIKVDRHRQANFFLKKKEVEKREEKMVEKFGGKRPNLLY